MDKRLLYCVTLLLVGAKCQEEIESRVVSTDQGPVRGYKGVDGDYFTFFGIPYATEPTGRDKFKAPLPGPTWQEPFEAVDYRIVCPQILGEEMANARQRDNCLIANVYVPVTNETNLPVVVYVHGGSYVGGAGVALSPKMMVMRGNFIAVSFNYRLGVHGFLCLGTEQIPGNAGMKDMVALLRWVNRNIGSFGGSPNDVTLSGYSAGASAVDLIMLSPLARGLFHKVIPESGSAAAVWSLQQDPFENAKLFAESLGFISNDVYELEDFYTSLSIEEVVSILQSILYFKDSTVKCVPCVERRIVGVESFLEDSATSIIESGNYARVPYLVGFTEMEALMVLNLFDQRLVEMNDNFYDFLPADLTFQNNQEKEEVANIIKEFYFGNQSLSVESIYAYLAFFGDISFVYPALRTVQMLTKSGSESVYVYEYLYYDKAVHSFPVPNSEMRVHGAGHCAQTDELLEHLGVITDDIISEEHLRMRNTLRQLWINFIRTGTPLPEPTEEFPAGWPAASATMSPHMRLANSSSLAGIPRQEEVAFWDSIYEKYYLEPIPPPEHADRNAGRQISSGILIIFVVSSWIFVVDD